MQARIFYLLFKMIFMVPDATSGLHSWSRTCCNRTPLRPTSSWRPALSSILAGVPKDISAGSIAKMPNLLKAPSPEVQLLWHAVIRPLYARSLLLAVGHRPSLDGKRSIGLAISSDLLPPSSHWYPRCVCRQPYPQHWQLITSTVPSRWQAPGQYLLGLTATLQQLSPTSTRTGRLDEKSLVCKSQYKNGLTSK